MNHICELLHMKEAQSLADPDRVIIPRATIRANYTYTILFIYHEKVTILLYFSSKASTDSVQENLATAAALHYTDNKEN